MNSNPAQSIQKCPIRTAPQIMLMAVVILLAFSAAASADDASGAINPPTSNPSTAPSHSQTDYKSVNAPGAQHRPLVMLDRLCQSAMKDVSDDQKAKVQAIHDKAATDLKDITADTTQPIADRLEKTGKLMADVRRQIADVLPEQRNKFLELPGYVDQQTLQRVGEQLLVIRQTLSKLNLSDEQKTSINAAFAQALQQFAAASQARQNDLHTAAEKARSVIRDLRTRLNEILTSDQQRQLKDKLPAESAESFDSMETPLAPPALMPTTMPATMPVATQPTAK